MSEVVEKLEMRLANTWSLCQADEIARLRAALEEILEAHNYAEVLKIAREALTKEEGEGFKRAVRRRHIEIERLRAALEASRKYLRHHHNASAWWNDPLVNPLMKQIETALSNKEGK